MKIGPCKFAIKRTFKRWVNRKLIRGYSVFFWLVFWSVRFFRFISLMYLINVKLNDKMQMIGNVVDFNI